MKNSFNAKYPESIYEDFIDVDGESESSVEFKNDKRMTRDHMIVSRIKIPFSVPVLVSIPMEEFNGKLTKYDLTEEQANICKDIRRRGKNKVRKRFICIAGHKIMIY